MATKRKPYPVFMRSTRTEILLSPSYTHRIVHLPTGTVVQAATRDEAVALLAAELEKRNGAAA